MKFEEFLKENSKQIQHDTPKVEMWKHIESKVRKEKFPIRGMNSWKIASVLIVVLGALFVFSKYSSNEVVIKKSSFHKSQMAKLAKGEKTSQRIMAINMLEDTPVEDEEIIKILIERMQLDESNNVRLAAVRALTKYIDNENVRVAMLDELVTVKDPYLQSKLITALREYKVNADSQEWGDLLEDKSQESTQFEYGIRDM